MIKIAILTPLALERDAVLKHLTEAKSVTKNSELYHIGYFSGQHHEFEIIVKKTGAGNETVTLAAEKMIVRYSPKALFLTGIAGGVKDVKIGDVVVGIQAHGYDIGKETEGGFKARPDSFRATRSLVNLAEIVADAKKWKKRAPFDTDTKVYLGPIASGNKVIASINHSTFQIIKNHYNNTIALEMEAYGVGKALDHHADVSWINIRGISDLCGDKNATSDVTTQPFAAAQAAAFLFEMLDNIEAQISGNTSNTNPSPQQKVEKTNQKTTINTENIKKLIQRSKIKKAINELLIVSKSIDADLYNEVLQQSAAWNALAKEERMGTVSRSHANVSRNRITSAILEILEELEEE